MDVRIKPRALSGNVAAIASKSEAHRLLICAALSEKETKLIMNKRSEDIDATIECLRALGAEIEIVGEEVSVKPVVVYTDESICGISAAAFEASNGTDCSGYAAKVPVLDCKESGSTLRFMLPVAAAVCDKVSFTGSGRLPERPIGELLDAMKANGVASDNDKLPLTLSGKLRAGCCGLPGNISSQYITGLLLALPLIKDEGKKSVKLTSKLESAGYVDITLNVLRRFGVEYDLVVDDDGLVEYVLQESGLSDGFKEPGDTNAGRFKAQDCIKVDGDWSNGAFFLVSGAIGNKVEISGLSLDSPQGDKAIIEILKKFGANISIEDDIIKVLSGTLHAAKIDINETPDALPILAVLASFADGETEFVNGARLRIKESDRLKSTAEMINNLGGYAEEKPEGLTVVGNSKMNLRGGTVDSFHDHRIVMAAAIAATRCDGDVIIKDAGAVAKSYPDFFKDYEKLGGMVDVI